MTEYRDPAVEIALLRGALYLTANVLKDYQGAPHSEIEDDCDGTPMLEVIVPGSVRQRAVDALARANGLLRDEGRGRC